MKGGGVYIGCNKVIDAACALKGGSYSRRLRFCRKKSKKRQRKMKGGGDFFKNLFSIGQKSSDSSINESKPSEKSETKNLKEVDYTPFDHKSDSSNKQVNTEQAVGNKSLETESSSSHTQQLDFKRLWENVFEHGKISGGNRRKSKKFKKHYMWNTKGKRYIAKTHKQHLRGVKLGHTHKKPKRK